jgi:hypothetical protein
MKQGITTMNRLELIVGHWRIVIGNIMIYFGIDLVDIELPLKIFVLICSAIISVITIIIKYKQLKRLK